MKRKIELLMGLCVILCAFVLARKGAVFVQSEQAKSAPVCIVVDAGHGGDDPGKIGINDALEKDINLQIALKLQKILEQNNIKVVMTRNTDAGLYSEGATNKKAEDMAVQGAGIVFFLHGFVGGNGLGAVDIFLRDVPPHGAVDGSPVQKSIGAVQTGLDGGSHQPQVELCRLQGVGAHILVGEGEQRRAHGQRGKDGKKAHPPHDLPPQRETMAALHSGASFPVIFCILSFIQY